MVIKQLVFSKSNHQFYEKHKSTNPHFWKLTVEEFLEISQKINLENKYEYGLKGLAKFSVVLFLKP